jgi:integrase
MRFVGGADVSITVRRRPYQSAVFVSDLRTDRARACHQVCTALATISSRSRSNAARISRPVRNAIMPLRVVFKRALRDELVAVNPCAGLELPANRQRRERAATSEDATKLIGTLAAPFDRALWATALYAGLRRGELMALRWSDVDLHEGAIRVERAYDPKAEQYVATKSRAGRRRVPIAAALRHAFLEHQVAFGAFDPDGLVFGESGRPFDDEAARNRARDEWTAVGLEPIGLHEARHTAASVMIAAGVNVKALSEFLGHASITITLDRYGHLLPGSLTEAAGLLDAYLARASS